MRIIENLLNDRALVADDEPARPLEIIYHGRLRQVDTLFGVVELRRCYFYHTEAHTGRHPLDEALDLVRGHTPGLARIISRAVTQLHSDMERPHPYPQCPACKTTALVSFQKLTFLSDTLPRVSRNGELSCRCLKKFMLLLCYYC
jgi:hypothetical protein